MPPDRTELPHFSNPLQQAVGIFVLAGAAYILSAQWRMLEAFSSFGIANALMLGLMARLPRWRHWHSYLWIAMASYLAHVLAAQGTLQALSMAVADVAGIFMGVHLLTRLPDATVSLRREGSAMLLLLTCLVASTTTLLQWSLQWPAPANGYGWLPLLCAEFMNHLLVVPLVLSYQEKQRWPVQQWEDALPLLALLTSEILATVMQGPGAITFTLPALIWCALRYPLFHTALLFALFTVWKCVVLTGTQTSLAPTLLSPALSLRLELGLLWLGPLTVACSHTARKEVLQRLNYASQHDYLTRTLMRATFLQMGERALAQLRAQQAPMAVLMLDIDHFKQVNDEHGHAMGDTVLRGFAATLTRQLRSTDLIGRYGGEEFCVCLPGIALSDALSVAERLRMSVVALPFTTPRGQDMRVTVSIGLTHYSGEALPGSMEHALSQSDAQLYRAKAGGRNRVEHAAISHSSTLHLPAATPSLPANVS